jgi:hypothetical protein
VLAVFWLVKFIPETKDKSFTAIFNDFAELNGVEKTSETEKFPLTSIVDQQNE